MISIDYSMHPWHTKAAQHAHTPKVYLNWPKPLALPPSNSTSPYFIMRGTPPSALWRQVKSGNDSCVMFRKALCMIKINHMLPHHSSQCIHFSGKDQEQEIDSDQACIQVQQWFRIGPALSQVAGEELANNSHAYILYTALP